MKSNTLRQIIALSALLLLPLSLKAFEPAKPFPSQIKNARYVFSDEKINKGIDIVMGASVNEDLRMVFSGHQKGNNVSIFFGLVGVAVAATANGAAGKKAGSEKNFTQEITIPNIARHHVLDTFENSSSFTFEENATARFEMIPYAFVTKNKKEGYSKIHAMLKVKLYEDDESRKPIWMTRFFGEASGTFSDEDLLDSARIEAALEQAYQRAAWGMRMIINDEFETYKTETVKAQIVGLKNDKFKLPTIVLSEKDDLLLLRFPFGKLMPFSGYSVIDQASAQRSPLKKLKDKYKKDFER